MIAPMTVATPPHASELLHGALRREGRSVRFRPGHVLCIEGDRADRVLLIERGRVLLTCTSPSGRDVVLGVIGPGDIVGELSAFDGEPRSATAMALDEVEAVVAPASALTHALADVAAAHELIRVLAARLREGDRKRLEFAALDTLGRVAWRLLELSERFGHAAPDGIAVELPLSQEQLASWCGASREATVKALRTLRSLHSITTARKSVVIHDAGALRRQAQGIA
jgi:CRP-like cAMP-binding protein